MTADTYSPPAHGWTCFHCGETFTHTITARAHFGPHPGEEPGCVMRLGGEERSLLRRLRAAEAELARYRAEDSDADRAMGALRADHAQALIREEEKGYSRGMTDLRTERQALLTKAREIVLALWAVVPKYQKPTLERARAFLAEIEKEREPVA